MSELLVQKTLRIFHHGQLAQVQLVFAYVWVWFLLMGGARQVPELFWVIRDGDTTNDAAQLQGQTLIGDVVWLFLFWLLSLGALVYGGALLLRHAA